MFEALLEMITTSLAGIVRTVQKTLTGKKERSRKFRMASDWDIRTVQNLHYQLLTFEVEAARKLMEGLFPPGETFERPGIRVAHRRAQATTISGDFYNFIPRSDGSLGIYFVDVEGHGLSASNQARSFYQVVTDREWGLGDAQSELQKADEFVRESAIFQTEEVAFCMNFTEIDPGKKQIRHANAGMPFPLLFRWGESFSGPLQAAGIYVGAGYGRYPVAPARVDVQVGDGDLLVIASDGILEARDRRGRLFGQSGIIAAVSRTRHQSPENIADEIMRAVQQHTGGEQPEDDQTLVVVQLGQAVDVARLVEPPILEEHNGSFTLLNAGGSVAACHQDLRERLITWARNQGFDEERGRQVWSATWEAILNALRHGSKWQEVIHVRLLPDGTRGFLEVEIRQPIPWHDWDTYLGDRRKREVRETEVPLMGGTVSMLWLAEEIRVTHQGRRITMRFSPEAIPQRRISFQP